MAANTDRAMTEKIADLSNLPLEQLRVRWQADFGRAPPAHLPRALLLRLYAYRLQADAYGGLGSGTTQLLDRLARQSGADLDKAVPMPSSGGGRDQLRAGTVLTREHGGVHHRVLVVDCGYEWNGQNYASLSRVATEITGTRWNGPRFFGLPSSKAAR